VIGYFCLEESGEKRIKAELMGIDYDYWCCLRCGDCDAQVPYAGLETV